MFHKEGGDGRSVFFSVWVFLCVSEGGLVTKLPNKRVALWGRGSLDPSAPSETGLLAREYFRGRAAVYFMTVLTSMALFKYLQSAGFQLSEPALSLRVGRGAAKTRRGIGAVAAKPNVRSGETTAAGIGLARGRRESKTTLGSSTGLSADMSLARGWHFEGGVDFYFFPYARNEKPTSLETCCFGGERGNEMKSVQSLSPKSRAPFLKGGSETNSGRAEVCQWPQMNALRRPRRCDPDDCLSFHN